MSVIERERVEEVVAPREVTVADDLNRAADLLESGEWGWCQGGMRRGDSVCFLGALIVSTGNRLDERRDCPDGLNPRYWIANEALARVCPSLAAWNDMEHRTKREVVSMLRFAAEASHV